MVVTHVSRAEFSRMHILVWVLMLGHVVLGLGLEEERLVGWRGESYKPAEKPKGLWVQQIAWRPRAAIFHNFISEAEAQHIIDLAWPQMQRSTVLSDNGTSVVDDYRTSFGTFLCRHQTPVLKRIQERIALLTRAPVQNQEDMQILRYAKGQYYHEHTDSLDDDSPRMATLLIYLSDPIVGGETSFPDTEEWTHDEIGMKYSQSFSECAKGHVAFKPHRGDALLFWNFHPNGKTEDPMSNHEGCPVIEGVKWTTTTWIHTIPFNGHEWNGTHFSRELELQPSIDPGFCQDRHKQCESWTRSGECENNPGYMKGHFGMCRKSCQDCEICADDDFECYNQNRRKLEFLAFNRDEMTWQGNSDEERRAWARGREAD